MAEKALRHAPHTSLFLEVAFRRLLTQCLDISSGRATHPPEDLSNWQDSVLFHHHVATLEEQLNELAPRLPAATFKAYANAVANLRVQLRDPANEWALPDELQRFASVNRVVEDGSSHKNGPQVISAPVKARPSGAIRQPEGDLATQEQVQESLTDELAVLAASLKENTLSMEVRVRERGQVLDDTETALDKSLVGVRTGHKKASDIHKKRRLGFCMTLLALIGIVTAFIGMYIFIKLTSLAGYRAVPTAAPHLSHPTTPLQPLHTEL